jgi:hypothetical protein
MDTSREIVYADEMKATAPAPPRYSDKYGVTTMEVGETKFIATDRQGAVVSAVHKHGQRHGKNFRTVGCVLDGRKGVQIWREPNS